MAKYPKLKLDWIEHELQFRKPATPMPKVKIAMFDISNESLRAKEASMLSKLSDRTEQIDLICGGGTNPLRIHSIVQRASGVRDAYYIDKNIFQLMNLRRIVASYNRDTSAGVYPMISSMVWHCLDRISDSRRTLESYGIARRKRLPRHIVERDPFHREYLVEFGKPRFEEGTKVRMVNYDIVHYVGHVLKQRAKRRFLYLPNALNPGIDRSTETQMGQSMSIKLLRRIAGGDAFARDSLVMLCLRPDHPLMMVKGNGKLELNYVEKSGREDSTKDAKRLIREVNRPS
ncbi:MAG: hypothetical protein KGH98_05170 [Candidatus Micrarchaeota archaeon]|nr:hypothetical protein [Candidatus Micrarchaeota archaeon]